MPAERQPVRAQETEHPHRRLRRARPDNLDADTLHSLQRLAARHECGKDEVAERAVLEEQRAQDVAVDREVAQRLRHDRRQEDRLPGEEIQLAEEAAGAVTDDLVSGRVEDRHLPLLDRDERIGRVAHPKQHVTDAGRPPLTEVREPRDLRRREEGAGGRSHDARLLRRDG